MKDELYDTYTQKVRQIEASSGEVTRGLFHVSCLVRMLTLIDLYGSIRVADVLEIMGRAATVVEDVQDADV